MGKPSQEIFLTPYRMHVLTVLKEAASDVLKRNLPSPIGKAIEVGCGTGFFYQYLTPDSLKTALVGFDVHQPSLDIYHQISPEAQKGIGDSSNLPVEDGVADVVIGFSSFPLLTKDGVIKDIYRVLRPGGRLIAFQDSLIKGPWEDTVYDKMKRVESHHRLLSQHFSRDGWTLVDGEDPLEKALIVPASSLEQRIAPDIRAKVSQDKIVIAASNDTGFYRVHLSTLKDAKDRFEKLKDELGKPRTLESLEPIFGEESVEFIRLRYLVAEKTS